MGLGLANRIKRFLVAIFTFNHYFSRRRAEKVAERTAEREVVLKAFDAMQQNFQVGLEALSKISIANSQSQQAQAAALQEWISSFKQVQEAPTSHTLRDADEARMFWDQQLQQAEMGLPPEVQVLPEEQKIAWIMRHTGDPFS